MPLPHAFSRGRCIVCGVNTVDAAQPCLRRSPAQPHELSNMAPKEVQLLVAMARLLVARHPKAQELQDAWKAFHGD